jgi:hypothetical protein
MFRIFLERWVEYTLVTFLMVAALTGVVAILGWFGMTFGLIALSFGLIVTVTAVMAFIAASLES